MSFYKETFGYIIHQKPFKDSSLIITFFSEDQGLVQIIAKGIKKNKVDKVNLKTFCLLKIQYFGKSQLKTLSKIEVINDLNKRDLIEKTAAIYLNELIYLSLLENELATNVFNCYQYTLEYLGNKKLTPLLRNFEFALLKHNGFELNVDAFINENSWLTINDHMGLIEAKSQSQKICKVSDVRSFLAGNIPDITTQKRLNQLMIKAIDMSVSYKRIYSRELLKILCRG